MGLDLLNPSTLRTNYIHQLRQTLQAYSAAQVVVGEGLQNAIDATVSIGGGPNRDISIEIDLDERRVVIHDRGAGFPNDPSLLFLGGTKKGENPKKLVGLVGVGMKVVIFHSNFFRLQTRNEEGAYCFQLTDAYRFEQDPAPDLRVPDTFEEDPDPLAEIGTRIEYTFPRGARHDPVGAFIEEIVDTCFPLGINNAFGKVLARAVESKQFQSRFIGALAAYLRRYSYAGDVLNMLGGKNELANTKVQLTVRCADPAQFGENAAALFGDREEATVQISPAYLGVEETAGWIPRPKPGIFKDKLGRGGNDLSITHSGFDVLLFAESDDYDKLLIDARGNLPPNIQEYREKLYPKINGIVLVIGRIGQLEEFLPGGSRRVLSANGVVTSHVIDLEKGRNQQYVRCLDLIIDLDATLNYGKSQITDPHLVGRCRRFVNDAYARTLQNGAARWVGKIDIDADDQDDVFVQRPNLGLPDFVLQKVPQDENDVIALFFELAARGHLEGYRVLGLSQKDRYDGRGVFREAGHKGDPQLPVDDRQAQVVEFKVIASSIFRDLEREEKRASEIDLLIAWDEGANAHDKIGFADIVHSIYAGDRSYSRVQRYLQDSRTGAEVQVLLLKPIVEQLKREIAAGDAGA